VNHAVEEDRRRIHGEQRARDQAGARVEEAPPGHRQDHAREGAEQGLHYPDPECVVAGDSIDEGQEVWIELRLVEDVASGPVAGGDAARQDIELPAVADEQGEEDGVAQLEQVNEPDGQGRAAQKRQRPRPPA
jgi:hypothetical protein